MTSTCVLTIELNQRTPVGHKCYRDGQRHQFHGTRMATLLYCLPHSNVWLNQRGGTKLNNEYQCFRQPTTVMHRLLRLTINQNLTHTHQFQSQQAARPLNARMINCHFSKTVGKTINSPPPCPLAVTCRRDHHGTTRWNAMQSLSTRGWASSSVTNVTIYNQRTRRLPDCIHR